MRLHPVTAVWIGGALLAVAIFVLGPDGFVGSVTAFLEAAGDAIADAVGSLSVQAFDALRAGTLALFAVFLALGVMAARRGLKARRLTLVVSALFLLLTATGHSGDGFRWLEAGLLVALGASIHTRRLMAPKRTAPIAW